MKKELYKKSRIIYVALLAMITLIGCKKMVEVPAPVTSISAEKVFQTTSTAVSAVNELYIYLESSQMLVWDYIHTGEGADEISIFGTDNYYTNSLTASSGAGYWSSYYNQIFVANSVIEGIAASTALSQAVKNQLTGEAKFMRAFYYFYLVNLYGAVPLALTTDYSINRLLARSSEADVYKQIIQDLKDAQGLLSSQFLSSDLATVTSDRVRPTKWAATALLSRVYLYTDDYENAVIQSTALIQNSSLFSLTNLNNTFLKNSSESIWSLQTVNFYSIYNNTFQGYLFIMGQPSSPNSHYLSTQLYSAFEPGDARKDDWVDTAAINGAVRPFSYKYKVGAGVNAITEYDIIFRLGEQYLIRAEAYARLGNLSDAIADLNTIRTRARAAASTSVPDPLPALSASLSQSQLYEAVEHERQVELFTEGHRWFDLKRTPGFSNPSVSRADEVMPAVTQVKGGTWQSYQQLWPIPLEQIQNDPNMANAQNPGYN